MKTAEQKTKKVAFCCPQHGNINGAVEYLVVKMNTKVLVDIPVMYCTACQKYYTPFSNLLTLFDLHNNGCRVFACQSVTRRDYPRKVVRIPHFISTEEFNTKSANNREKHELQTGKTRTEKHYKQEKQQVYFDSLRKVEHDCIILTNKPCFINDCKCPICKNTTKKEKVKIAQHGKSVISNIRCCPKCDFDYITPEQFYRIEEKASRKIRGYISHPFVALVDTECIYQPEDDKYLFIPTWLFEGEYDRHNLPPKGDEFYDMSQEEYLWAIAQFQQEDFSLKFRQKSILGEAGYSTSESEIRRHIILKHCVEMYGKDRVIFQLKSNINLRLRQNDGNLKYERALNIWRGDICYVENQL